MAARFFLSRIRIFLLTVVISLVWLTIAARLVHIQFVKGAECARIAEEQSKGEIDVPAERGRLIDTRGRTLASNLACRSFFAYPSTTADAERIARVVAPYTPSSAGELAGKLRANLDSFTWLCRRLPEREVQHLQEREIAGLFSQKEWKRIYPTNGLGVDLIGMADIDNRGISGLEYALNERLCGRNGCTIIERDAHGRVYRVASRELLQPQNGCDVTLTIDLDWQAVVEAELERGVEAYGALSGTAVFLKPDDGAVLAMISCYPDQRGSRSLKNEAIADLFEPGSVFKLITAAAALEEGKVAPGDIIDCDSGRALFSGKVIRDDKKWDRLAFRDVFRFSSNIGMAKTAVKLGGRKLYKYARDFGFGSKSGIDLPGESAGSLRRPEVWSDHYAASLAMGHGISVNALQLAAAFSVIPSQGDLYQPYIIKQINSPEGEVLEVGSPRRVRHLLSPQTCDTLRQFLAAVVDSGTAKYSKSKIISFSGKTGTAQKPNLQSGGYYQDKYISSFAGYFPQDNPIAVGVVVLDNPQPLHYAGMTAARIFARIAERIASLLKLSTPTQYAAGVHQLTKERIKVPQLTGCTLVGARETLADIDLTVSLVNTGDTVLRQHPPGGSELIAGDELILCLTDQGSTGRSGLTDLVGLSVREAVAQLNQWGYQMELAGYGLVVNVEELTDNNDHNDKRCRLRCSMN